MALHPHFLTFFSLLTNSFKFSMANEPFNNATLPDFSTAENLASFISSSEKLFGESDAVVDNLQFIDGKYSKIKENAIQ